MFHGVRQSRIWICLRQRKVLLWLKSILIPFLRIRYATICILMILPLGMDEEAWASDDGQPYNLKLGPVNIRADASLTTSFNDNINLSEKGRQADILTDPFVGLHALWQLTDTNALIFDIGLGYEFYALHSENDNITIAPDSHLLFNMSVGDTKIKLHDDFSYQHNPLLVGQLSNSGRFPVLMNDAGVDLSWDLSDILLSVGYDHTSEWVFESAFEYLDYQEDSLSPELTLKLNQTIDVGLSIKASDMRYDKNVQNDNTTIMAGPFIQAQFTNNLSVNVQAGYISTTYAHGGSNGDNENINSFYGSVGVNHKINHFLTESLTGGRDYLPGLSSNFTQRTYANYTIGWQATSFINLASNLSWENLDDSNASLRETSNRYQMGLNLDYAVTSHASLTLGYQYVLKDSDVSILSFYQNLATVGLHYQF